MLGATFVEVSAPPHDFRVVLTLQESDAATRASGEAMRVSLLYWSPCIVVAAAVRLKPRLHRGGLRGVDERSVVVEGQHREVRQRNDRFRESSELVVVEPERL